MCPLKESCGWLSTRNLLRKATGLRWRSEGKRSTAKDCGDNYFCKRFCKLLFWTPRRTRRSWRRGGRRRRRGRRCWRRRSSRWSSPASSWVSTKLGRHSRSTSSASSRWKYKKPKEIFLFWHGMFCRDCQTLTMNPGTQVKLTLCSSSFRRWASVARLRVDQIEANAKCIITSPWVLVHWRRTWGK